MSGETNRAIDRCAGGSASPSRPLLGGVLVRASPTAEAMEGVGIYGEIEGGLAVGDRGIAAQEGTSLGPAGPTESLPGEG